MIRYYGLKPRKIQRVYLTGAYGNFIQRGEIPIFGNRKHLLRLTNGQNRTFDVHFDAYDEWFSRNPHVYRRKEENLFYREGTFYGCEEVISLLQSSGFEPPQVIQTFFGRLEEIHRVQDFRAGHGEGGFVVIRAAEGS